MATLATLIVKLTGDIGEYEKSMQQAESRASAFGGALKTAGTAATTGLAVAAGAAGAALVGVSAAGIKAFVDFEGQMNEVFTLMPGISGAAMDEMSDQVLQFSRDFAVMPEQVVPALYQSLSAGVPPDNVFEFLEVAQQAAVGGITELETAVDGITSVTNAYGSDMISAAEASDIMFTAVRLGKTDFGQLSSSLFNVIPAAASLGVEFTDVAAQLAVLTGQGVPTSVASTQIRSALNEAANSGSKLGGAISELTGKSFPELIAEGNDSASIFQSLRETMPDQEFRELFSSVEAMNAVLGITGPNFDKTQAALEETSNSAGATTAAYDTMNAGIGRSMERFKAFGATALIQIGNAFSPLIDTVLQLAEGAMPAIERALGVIQPFVAGLATAFSNLIMQLKNGVPLFTALGGLLFSVAMQLGLGGMEANQLANKFTALVTRAQELYAQITALLAPVIQAVAGFVSWKDVLIVAGALIAGTIVGALYALLAAIAPVVAAVAAAIAIVAALRTAWESNFLGIQEVFATVWQAMQTTWEAFKALFQGDFDTFWELIKEALSTALQAMMELFGNIYALVQPHLEAFWSNLQAWWAGIDWYQLGYDTVTFIIESLKTFWETAVPVVSSWWESIKSWFASVDWKQLGLDIINGIVNGLSGAGGKLFGAVKDLAQGALDAAKAALGISSPSRLAAQLIGAPFTQGIAAGMEDTRPVDRAMTRTVGPSMLAGAPGGGGGVSLSAPINITVNGNADADDIAAKVQQVVDRLLFDAMRRQGITAS